MIDFLIVAFVALALSAPVIWAVTRPSNLDHDRCLWCGEKTIVLTSRIMNRYQREMHCLLCQRLCTKDDRELKRQQLLQVAAEIAAKKD